MKSDDSNGNSNTDFNTPNMDLTRRVAVQALALSVQEWNDISEGQDPTIATTSNIDVCVDRVTSLMLVRLVAIIAMPLNQYQDLSTSGICRKTLIENQPWWPEKLTAQVISQLRRYVKYILTCYNKLPFHNFQHAYHVVVSANKLMDLMLTLDSDDFLDGRPPPAFGLRHDPVALLALIFSALVHDVDHKGISNRQLILEEHPLALFYNDNSINEHHSLRIAFEELLKDKYAELRAVMFPQPGDYRYFRTTVVSAVLSTDIASPERAQVSKSKWKEAFSEEVESANNNNNMVHARRSSMASDISKPRVPAPRNGGHRVNRRGSNASVSSMVSDVTMDSYARMMRSRSKINMPGYDRNSNPRLMMQEKQLRMAAGGSPDSDFDSLHQYNNKKPHIPAAYTPRNLNSNSNDDSLTESGGDGSSNNYSSGRQMYDYSSSKSSSAYNKISATPSTTPRQRQQPSRFGRRHSTTSYNSDSFASYAQESIDLAHKRQQGIATSRNNNNLEIFRKLNPDNRPAAVVGQDSNSSISLTPPSSDDENDYEGDDSVPLGGVLVTRNNTVEERMGGAGHLNHRHHQQQPHQPSPYHARPGGSFANKHMRISRRASTGNVPVRFGSLAGQRIDEHEVNNASFRKLLPSRSNSGSAALIFHRRASGGNLPEPGTFRKRLSILRSMDFSGEQIEVYSSQRGSIAGASSVMGGGNGGLYDEDVFYDEPDELRASVVLELMLRAADVAHSLQSWTIMSKWSSRLFKELAAANRAGRGPDPGPGWFDNQAKALESYVLPLARQLDEMGVFGEFVGAVFSQRAEDNRDNWLVKGFELTEVLREKEEKTRQHYFL